MRPDRIIVGEVRGAEALDMLQAMNTGHDGSLSTLHANSPRDALVPGRDMVLMAGFDLPMRAIREQAASAIDLLVHIGRLTRRRAAGDARCAAVDGMEGEIITLSDLFVVRRRGPRRDKAAGSRGAAPDRRAPQAHRTAARAGIMRPARDRSSRGRGLSLRSCR